MSSRNCRGPRQRERQRPSGQCSTTDDGMRRRTSGTLAKSVLRSRRSVRRMGVARGIWRGRALLDGAGRAFLTADGASPGRTVVNRAGRACRALDDAWLAQAGIDGAGGSRRAVVDEAGDLAGAEAAVGARATFIDVAAAPGAGFETTDGIGAAAVHHAATHALVDGAVVAIATGADLAASIANAQVAVGILARAFEIAATQAARDRALAALARHGTAAGLAAVQIARRAFIAGGRATARRRLAVG